MPLKEQAASLPPRPWVREVADSGSVRRNMRCNFRAIGGNETARRHGSGAALLGWHHALPSPTERRDYEFITP